MPEFEEETYSTIFTALKHPIRRRILRLLSEGPRGFAEMQNLFKVDSPYLTYHLESLRDLVSKTEDGRYRLSSMGESAAALMKGVEETPKHVVLSRALLPKRKVALYLGLILLLVGVAGGAYSICLMLSPEEVLLDVTFLLIHNKEIRTYKLSLPSREIHVQFSSNATTWPNVVYLILADSKNADLILKDAYENIDWYECPDGRSALSQAAGRRRLEGVLLTHKTGNLPHAPWIVQRPAWGTYRFLVSKKWNNNVPIQVTLTVTASGYDSWIEQISVATMILGGILLGFYSRILQHMFTRYTYLYSKLRRRIYPRLIKRGLRKSL